jgi:hypothetical protein
LQSFEPLIPGHFGFSVSDSRFSARSGFGSRLFSRLGQQWHTGGQGPCPTVDPLQQWSNQLAQAAAAPAVNDEGVLVTTNEKHWDGVDMPAMGFGLLVVLMGLFTLAISGPLSKLVTNWNLFLREENMDAYRSKKRRGIRILAKVWIALGICLIVEGFIAWIVGSTQTAA